jgi:cytochrome c oxidase subunit 1
MGFYGVPQGVTKLPPQVHGREAGETEAPDVEGTLRPRGTFVLVGVFLVAFIVYYFVNWKLLSSVWQVG